MIIITLIKNSNLDQQLDQLIHLGNLQQTVSLCLHFPKGKAQMLSASWEAKPTLKSRIFRTRGFLKINK